MELQPDGARARLEPAWSPALVRARLDAELGIEGWSYALSAAGDAGVLCTLTIGGTSRAAAAAAAARSLPLEGVAELAFARCARQFGIAPPVATEAESYWVDFDPEEGEPLYVPEPVPADAGGAPAPVESVAPEATAGSGGAAPTGESVEREASSEALATIERLVERLKSEGKGKEAARLVARYHGSSAEEARELYRHLRALLLGGEGEE